MRRKSGLPSDESHAESSELSLYDQVIGEAFLRHFKAGETRLVFSKDELVQICAEHDIAVRNLPDVIYSFRTRRPLPPAILETGNWAIEPAGKGSYAFRLLRHTPHFGIRFSDFAPVDIYNALPEVVEAFLRKDEQSLLTVVLYNRLVDVFTGLTCFHIQNHYRSFVRDLGQVELDALYVGVDHDGRLSILPLEAKGQSETEMIGRVQVCHMSKLAGQDFPQLRRKIIAVKALEDGCIGMVEFDDREDPNDVGIVSIARYRLIRRNRGS